MVKSPLFYVLVGIALYYGFLRFRGTIAGAPWAPTPALVGPRAA